MTHSIFTTRHFTLEELIAIDDSSWHLSHLADCTWLIWKPELIRANSTYKDGIIVLGSVAMTCLEDAPIRQGVTQWRLFRDWLIEEKPPMDNAGRIYAADFQHWATKPRHKSVLI